MTAQVTPSGGTREGDVRQAPVELTRRACAVWSVVMCRYGAQLSGSPSLLPSSAGLNDYDEHQ